MSSHSCVGGRKWTALAILVGLIVFTPACLEAAETNTPIAPSSSSEAASSADNAAGGGKDILDMDVEQLSKVDVKVPSMDIEVTSVAKQESTVGQSAAAIFVITPEMIRRSGATNIPDLLRLVPGMDVAQINSHTWAVAARGLNGQFSQRLLVLIDGRSVYNQLFGGVYWDVQDTMLEDIERIEVIRGPGGTLWGSNAVNGVVNIITKKAQDTQGTLITAGGGNWDRLNDAVRVGGNNGDGLYWRVYGKHFERGDEWAANGAHDSWRQGRGGFRMDWDLDRHDTDKLTVQGDYYGGNEGQEFLTTVPHAPWSELIRGEVGVSGANVLTRWNHTFDEDSDWMFQAYFDRTFRTEYAGTQQTNTFDVEFQHRFPLTKRHGIIWGLDYRQVHDYIPTDTFFIDVFPVERTTNLFSGFIQDEIALVEDRLTFTIGTKLERNSFTGFECQPSARLLWSLDKRHVAWGAISRAVRIPSRIEENAVLNLGPLPEIPLPTFLQYMGSTDLKAESVIAYEIGYRAQTTDRFAWDVATFCNVYEDLLWGVPTGFFPEDGYWYVPFPIVNGWRGHIYGVELNGLWTLTDRWRVSAWYSVQQFNFENAIGTADQFRCFSPNNQARLQSSWDLGHSWQFDLRLRYVDTISEMSVPEYVTMDLRLGWQPNKNWELALVGQNLLDNHHPEFGYEGFGYLPAEIRRTVFAVATLRR